VYPFKIWWKLLHHAEIIDTFEIQDGGRRHRWIFKFSFLYKPSYAHSLATVAVKFGKDMHYKLASIFRIFCFWLEFPIGGPFWSSFLGVDDPQKAQLAAERRHMVHWSWKSADHGGRWAWRWRIRQKRDRHFPWYFSPFPGANQNKRLMKICRGRGLHDVITCAKWHLIGSLGAEL